MAKQKTKTTSDRQYQSFVEAARKLGADDSEAAFDAKLKKIAKAAPPQKRTTGKGRARVGKAKR